MILFQMILALNHVIVQKHNVFSFIVHVFIIGNYVLLNVSVKVVLMMGTIKLKL